MCQQYRMSESDLLAHIFSISGGINASSGDVLVGPGDDCAAVQIGSGDILLLTVDQLVEGRHFSSGTPIDLIARKAVARSMSDIAAMGGVPRWSLATGLLPDGYEHGQALSAALHRWSRHWQTPMIGGDIAFGPGPLSLSVTVIGSMAAVTPSEPTPGPILRSGAKVGDLLWLSGPVGGSFASGHHLHFEPRLDVGRAAVRANASSAAGGGVVHAMIDLSDGLGRDAARVGKASGVVLEIDAWQVPRKTDQAGNVLPWMQACCEGEDYELLLAIAPGCGESHRTLPEELRALDRPLLGPIGRVVACSKASSERVSKADTNAGAVIRTAEGACFDATDLGFDHGIKHS